MKTSTGRNGHIIEIAHAAIEEADRYAASGMHSVSLSVTSLRMLANGFLDVENECVKYLKDFLAASVRAEIFEKEVSNQRQRAINAEARIINARKRGLDV